MACPRRSLQTVAAERGLGIQGQPYYFYVLRAEDSYGFVVFVLREIEDAVWRSEVRGATPFDSGGWWWNEIHTDPPLNRESRQSVFRTLDMPLQDWRAAFERHVLTRYDTLNSYVEGRPPTGESLDTGFTIIKGKPNGARAWTWEVRVPHGLIPGRIELQAAYMADDSRDEYVDWLWDGPLEDYECFRIHQWIKEHVTVPLAGQSVVRAVRKSILQGVANG